MAKIKKRSDGRYTVTTTVNGKRKYFYGRTRVEAQDKCDAYLFQAKKATHFDDTLLFRDWVDYGYHSKKSRLRPIPCNRTWA